MTETAEKHDVTPPAYMAVEQERRDRPEDSACARLGADRCRGSVCRTPRRHASPGDHRRLIIAARLEPGIPEDAWLGFHDIEEQTLSAAGFRFAWQGDAHPKKTVNTACFRLTEGKPWPVWLWHPEGVR